MTPAPKAPADSPPPQVWPLRARDARALGTGAEVTDPPHETDYGSRDFAARDPEGNLWSFGTYRDEPRAR